jgi:NAD(P)-dependent dehydrogenase (short-subunit alcohol dehydrogenase family)
MTAPILITGTSKGLGKALAKEFEKLGHIVVGCSRHPLDHPHHFQVDCSKLAEVQAFAEEVVSDFGVPSRIIHNASVINTPGPSWEQDAQEVEALFRINVLSTFYLIKAFIPFMIKAQNGIFITISTEWGRHGEGKVAPYSSSKFAIEGWMQALSKELPSPLAAIALDPRGGFQTQMLEKGRPEVYSYGAKPDQWAQVAAPFILSLGKEDSGKPITCPALQKTPSSK